MIYQSEHVLSVFTCSEIVKFWSSAYFQSSATYHLFYLSILSFNSCVIEIQLFSYNILENFCCLILPFQSGTSHLGHILGHCFSSVFLGCVCMNALPFIFIFCLLGSSVWTFFILPLNLFPNSLSSHSSWRWRHRPLSSFCSFVLRFRKKSWRIWGFFCSYSFAVLVGLLNVPKTQVEETCLGIYFSYSAWNPGASHQLIILALSPQHHCQPLPLTYLQSGQKEGNQFMLAVHTMGELCPLLWLFLGND